MSIDRRKIGIPTLIEYNSFQESINLAQELNIGFIEINLDIPIFSNIEELKRMIEIKSDDIFYTIHLPEATDFISLVDTYRFSYVKYLEEIAERISAFKVLKINTHLNTGVYFNLPNEKKYLNTIYSRQYFDILHNTFNHITKILQNTGHHLNIENSGIGNHSIIKDTIHEIMKYKSIMLTRDIGHEAKNKNVDSYYLTEYKERIDHYHLHDYDQKKDHLELYSGYLEISKIIQEVPECGATAVIEVKAEVELRKSINKLKEMKMMSI